MRTIMILGILYLLSGFLFVLVMVLLNPIHIFIDTLVLIGFSIITICFLIFFLKINKEVKTNENK